MSAPDHCVEHSRTCGASSDEGDLLPPARGVAVVACTGARLDPARLLGLEGGDVHVTRDAGGAVTQDALRSLAVSQRLRRTHAVVLLHRTDCHDDDVRQSMQADPVEPHRDAVRGSVDDVTSGSLRDVP